MGNQWKCMRSGGLKGQGHRDRTDSLQGAPGPFRDPRWSRKLRGAKGGSPRSGNSGEKSDKF